MNKDLIKPNYTPAMKSYWFRDVQDVVQPDGAIARFFFDSTPYGKNYQYGKSYTDAQTHQFVEANRAKGWQFASYLNSHGFSVVEPDKQLQTPYPDMRVPVPKDLESFYNPDWASDNEEIHAFSNLGPLSGRAGFYISPKGEPERVLRVLTIIIS